MYIWTFIRFRSSCIVVRSSYYNSSMILCTLLGAESFFCYTIVYCCFHRPTASGHWTHYVKSQRLCVWWCHQAA